MGNRIRVLHILAGGRIGGAERSVQWLAQVYNRQEFEYVFVFLYFGGQIQQAIENMGFDVHILNWGSGYSIWGRYKLLKLIWSVKPDLIHFHETTPLVKIFLKLFFPFMPIIYTCHGVEENSRIAKIGQIIDDKFINCVITNSDYTTRTYSKRYHRKISSIIRIYLGIYLERYRNSIWVEPVKHPIKGDFLDLIYLGRLQDYKGVLDLPFLALKLKNMGFHNFRINIVGDGPARYRIGELVKSMGVDAFIVFWGQQEDVVQYLQNSDILLFPSWWEEPFGLVLLEAIACGLSIVAYKSGAVEETIGNLSFVKVVEKKDVGAMANAVMDIAKNKGYPHISECILYLENNFDIYRTAQKIEAVYRNTLQVRQWDTLPL